MSSRSRVLILVLAEDAIHQRFIYRYLRQQFDSHEIRIEIAPEGRGSAEQWVRERYPHKVKQYRTRAAQTAVIALIDADSYEVSERDRHLQQALELAGMDRRSEQERIAHLIPKRHIETWILSLNNFPVDEQEDCKHHAGLDLDAQIKPAAVAFFDASGTRTDLPHHWVDSLRRAIPEIRKIRRLD